MIRMTAIGQPDSLLARVEQLSGQNLHACYQCGTCSAGCPFVTSMDILPEKIIRRITFGLQDVLESETIWVCASCSLCSERCPRDIDVASIMEALRQIRLRQSDDHINLAQIPQEVLADMPPIALVASFRKHMG